MAETGDEPPPDEYPPDHVISAPMMEAVGNVAHHWANLELEINKAIWSLAAVSPEAGACLTAQIIPVMPRMRALISLVALNGGSATLVTDLNRFATEIDGIGRRRNRVIHDPWFFRTRGNPNEFEVQYGRLEISADRKLVYETKPQSRADVLKIAEAAVKARFDFLKLCERIQDEVRAQPGSHPDKY